MKSRYECAERAQREGEGGEGGGWGLGGMGPSNAPRTAALGVVSSLARLESAHFRLFGLLFLIVARELEMGLCLLVPSGVLPLRA